MAQHILALSHVSLMRMYQLRSRENTHTHRAGERKREKKRKKKERKDLFHLFVCRRVVAGEGFIRWWAAFRQSDTETLPNFPSLILYLTQRILATTPLSLSLHSQKGWREEESECYTDVVVVGSSRERGTYWSNTNDFLVFPLTRLSLSLSRRYTHTHTLGLLAVK